MKYISEDELKARADIFTQYYIENPEMINPDSKHIFNFYGDLVEKIAKQELYSGEEQEIKNFFKKILPIYLKSAGKK